MDGRRHRFGGVTEPGLQAGSSAPAALTCTNTRLRRCSPHRVRRTTEHQVHGLSCPVLGIRPKVRVRVERLGRCGMPQPLLNDLYRFAMADQQRGVVMPQSMKAGPPREISGLGSRTPHRAGEPGAPDRLAVDSSEDKTDRYRLGCRTANADRDLYGWIVLEVSRKRIEDNTGERHGSVRATRLRRCQERIVTLHDNKLSIHP